MIKLINDFIDINENVTENLEILYENVTNGIERFINHNILDNENFNETECYKYLKNINNELNQNMIRIMIQYTNFQISAEVSDEIECTNKGLYYALISYRLKKNPDIKKKNKKILNFLKYGITLTTGICLVQECKNILEDNFNMKKGDGFGYKLNKTSKLYKYLNDTIDMRSFTLFKSDDKNSDKDIGFSSKNPTFIGIIITFFVLILIRIIVYYFCMGKN